MRLLKLEGNDEFSLTHNIINPTTPCAILSHTWEADNEEVNFKDCNSVFLFTFIMALKLHIPPCIATAAHRLHPPPLHRPLRIQIEVPNGGYSKAAPKDTIPHPVFLHTAGPEPAKLAYQQIFRREEAEVNNELVIRDEYLG
jgi:hypothetical protein